MARYWDKATRISSTPRPQCPTAPVPAHPIAYCRRVWLTARTRRAYRTDSPRLPHGLAASCGKCGESPHVNAEDIAAIAGGSLRLHTPACDEIA